MQTTSSPIHREEFNSYKSLITDEHVNILEQVNGAVHCELMSRIKALENKESRKKPSDSAADTKYQRHEAKLAGVERKNKIYEDNFLSMWKGIKDLLPEGQAKELVSTSHIHIPRLASHH